MFPPPRPETGVVAEDIPYSEEFAQDFIESSVYLLILLSITEAITYYIEVPYMSGNERTSSPLVYCSDTHLF